MTSTGPISYGWSHKASGCALLLAVLLMSLLSGLTTGSAASGEFRGVWVDGWHTGFKTTSQVRQLVADAKAGGINALLVEVRKRGDAYYNSRFEPPATDLAVGYDPLADLVRQAHAAQPRIEVHAWIVTFPIWNSETAPTSATHAFNRHPEWLMADDTGATWTGDNYQLDPGHPGVQQHTFDVAMDIIDRYDVDGFHFDYVRYPGRNWGYNPVAVYRFNRRYNRTGVPDPSDATWMQWRRDQVSSLVRRIYLAAWASKPSVRISAATIPWGNAPASDSDWIATDAYSYVFQDWRAWMQEGILDMNLPMVYRDQATGASGYAGWRVFAVDRQYRRQAGLGLGWYLNSISNDLVQIRATRLATTKGAVGAGWAGFSYASPTSDGLPRATFLSALTQSNVAKVYDATGAPALSAWADPPAMPWKLDASLGHLLGRVTEAGTGDALERSAVTLTGTAARTLAVDGSGCFGGVDLPVGAYTAALTLPGFASRSIAIEVRGAAVTRLDEVLAPAADTAHVRGRVMQSSPSQPLAGAQVVCAVQGIARSAMADEQGYFRVTGLPLGACDVTASYPGMYPATFALNLASNVVYMSDFQLAPLLKQIAVWPGADRAIVDWVVSQACAGLVEFGVSTNLGRVVEDSSVAAGSHSMLLTGLQPNQLYYFRIGARIDGGTVYGAMGQFATAGETVVDDSQAAFTGSWTSASAAADRYGAGYRYVSAVTGADTAQAVFRPPIMTPGYYDVYVWYPQGANRATNVVITVETGGVVSRRTVINQTAGGGVWRLIGVRVPLVKSGDDALVRIGNGVGASGRVVVADAVRWVYSVGQFPPSAGEVPLWWSTRYFGTAASADGGLDPDRDGFTNAEEYRAGTDPTRAGSRLSVAIERDLTGGLVLEWNPGYGGFHYSLWVRDGFGPGTAWAPADFGGDVTFDEGSRGSAALPQVGGSARFYRIQVDAENP